MAGVGGAGERGSGTPTPKVSGARKKKKAAGREVEEKSVSLPQMVESYSRRERVGRRQGAVELAGSASKPLSAIAQAPEPVMGQSDFFAIKFEPPERQVMEPASPEETVKRISSTINFQIGQTRKALSTLSSKASSRHKVTFRGVLNAVDYYSRVLMEMKKLQVVNEKIEGECRKLEKELMFYLSNILFSHYLSPNVRMFELDNLQLLCDVLKNIWGSKRINSGVFRALVYRFFQIIDVQESAVEELCREISRYDPLIVKNFLLMLKTMELFGNRYESMYLKTASQMTGNISQAFRRLSKEKEMAGLKAALKEVDDMMGNPIYKSTFAMKYAISEIIVTRQSLLQKDYAEGVSKGHVDRLFNLMTALIGGDIGSVSDPNYAVAALKYFYQYRDNEAVKATLRQFSEIAKGDENHGLIICSLVVDFILNKEPVDMERYKGDGYDYCYALMHFVQGDDQEARKYAEKSTYAEASWILGQLSLKRKDYLSAIDYFQQAIGRGLPAAWINLVEVYLTKGAKTDIVIQALEGVCRHERYLGFHTSAPWELLLDEIREFGAIETEEEQVARALKELEVFDPEPKQETRKTGGSQKSKKGRGKRKGDETSLLQESQKSEVQPTVYGAGIAEVEAVEHQYKELRKSQLRLYKCQITKNINLRNYQEAIRLVIESCTMTENIIQRVSLGESALWIIRAMVNDKIYRDLDTNALTTVQNFSKENWLTSSLKSDVGKKFNDSAIKICHFLYRDDAALDPVVLRPMMNKVGCLFLGYLHNNNPDEWQDNPMEMIRMLKESGFKAGAELVFITGSHLSFQGHLHEDMDELDKSKAFYQAANDFNIWRLVIKEKGRLPARISHKTPMGKMRHKPVK